MPGERFGSHACTGPWLLLLTILSIGCGPDARELRAADPRPDILIVSMDTTRADHLSAYGYGRDTSPNLRALAAQGMRFETAYAPSATTGPSHASLFTSLYPVAHGVLKNGHSLDAELDTLAERLSREGFDSAAVVSSYVLDARFGYGQGFARYDADFSQADVPSGVTLWEGEEIEGKFYGSADDTTRRALAWLDARPHPESPFFLFVHYFDPHDPYLMPAGFQPPFVPTGKEALKLNREIFRYDTLLAFTDREIGRLLARLAERGRERDTIVIVTGDHGEGLMQHGHMFHGAQVYEEAVRVPLIFRWPAQIAAGTIARQPVQLMDLAPTLFDLLGIDTDEGLQGTSLAGLLRGQVAEDAQRPIHLYRRHYEGGEVAPGIHAKGEKFGLRVGRWKLIDGPDEQSLELFDLELDPGELSNLAEAQPERAARMRLRLRHWRERHTRGDRPAGLLSEEDRARLEALGYVE